MKTMLIWIKGLCAAIVSAASNAVVLAIADPSKFNPSRVGWHDLGIVALLSAVTGAAAYLKQSPVPGKPMSSTK